MQTQVRKYVSNDTGAVTVDWVILAGFTIALAISVATALAPELKKTGVDIVSSADISTNF